MTDFQQLLIDWQPLLRVLMIALGAFVIRLIVKLAARRVVRTVSKTVKSARIKSVADQRVAEARVLQRTRTIASVLDRTASWGIWITATVMVLSELGIEIGALIAVTTVLGAAIGFGAQSAVKDLIAGVFIIFEDQYGVGDWVELDGIAGEVERIGLRTTQLRDHQGTLWFVRNGEILKVGNSSQEWAKSVVMVGFESKVSVAEAEGLIGRVGEILKDDPELGPLLLGEIEFLGVEQIGSDRYMLRIAVKTLPNKQWQVGNAIHAALLHQAQRNGIKVLEANRPAPGAR